MSALQIESRLVGAQQPVLVVAEIGVNHDGSVQRALELVRHAAAAGADAVKLQIFRAAALAGADTPLAAYQRQSGMSSDQATMLARLELSARDLGEIVSAIRAAGMLPLATPFSPADVDTVAALGLPAVKIASPDLINRVLLRRAAALGKPLLLSTGACEWREIETAARWLDGWGAHYALLHCISAYPAAEQEANLCWIGELAARFGVPAGFSDHSTSEIMGALAVAAGAAIVEKHLTYDRNATGPDHRLSADPAEFARYVGAIRLAEAARGRPGRRVLECEHEVRRLSRQSLALARDVPAGHIIGDADLTTRRPGTGIPPAELDSVVGRRMRLAAAAGTLLRREMME